MKINKYYRTLICLFVALSNVAFSETAGTQIEAAISKIEEIEKQVNYDKTIVKNVQGSQHVGENEKVFVTFNTDYDATRSYVVYSNQRPNTVKVVNNAALASYAEVFTSKHGHDYTNLIYFENNGTVTGTANNVTAMSLYAPYVYFKNDKL